MALPFLVNPPSAPAPLQLFIANRSPSLPSWTVVGKGDGLTIPVRKPSKRIDYIWISKDSVTPVTMDVLYSDASDHLPIIAELKVQ